MLPPFPDSQHLLDPLTCCIVTSVSSMEAVCEKLPSAVGVEKEEKEEEE